MKAERINQDQIRFTLSEADLTSRNLQMSELSYGSEKTKALFDDMMRAAYEQFGVDFSQKPLMIEAIPLSERSLTITVTRVTGAAELGSLFGANFGEKGEMRSPDGSASPWGPVWNDPSFQGPSGSGLKEQDDNRIFPEMPDTTDGVIYLFDRMEDLLLVASRISSGLKLKNALYSDEGKGVFYLVVNYKKIDPEIRYVVSLLSHFASEWFWGRHAELIVREHAKVSIKAKALQKLGAIERLDD